MPLYGTNPFDAPIATGVSPAATVNKVSATKAQEGSAGGGLLSAATGLLGGGLGAGALAGSSPSSSSKSGDASSGLTAPFQYNAAFQVGGSGSQSQSQSADQSGGLPGGGSVLVYVALGVVGLIAVAAVLRK